MVRGSPATASTEMPSVDLDLQVAVDSREVPERARILQWAEVALAGLAEARHSLTVRVVGNEEIRRLNHEFRGKDGPTNVLSFPFERIPGVESDYLGDIAICCEVVVRSCWA